MAAVSKPTYDEARRGGLSPRPKARENAKGTLCRNVTIYGKCKFEDKGCAFNHDTSKFDGSQNTESNNSLKKALNVDSPSFTPSSLSSLSANDVTSGRKPAAISPKAASAAPFQPKSVLSRSNVATPPVRQETATPEWAVAEVQEFVPHQFDTSSHSQLASDNTSLASAASYDPFHLSAPVQSNPYQDTNPLSGATFFQGPNTFQQPVQYHQYAPIGPHNANLLPYQRNVHDLFIPNELREELQKRSAATLQTLPNLQLPTHIENYHSLVPLHTKQKSSAIFGGYSSWIYKAQSSTNGNFVALRRLEGFRLTSEVAIRSVQSWKHIINPSIVRILDAFTNRSFGDSSLIFVTDYHPLSKTLAEHHFGTNTTARGRSGFTTQIPEMVLWSYVTQIASALKTIHSNGLAARVLDITKIILTGKNRIRLNGCAILDVVQHETKSSLAQMQRQDLVKFGLVILSLGAHAMDAAQNFAKAMDQFKRFYKSELQNAVVWLYSAQQNQDKTIDQFIASISGQMMTSFNATLHLDDNLHSELSREVENGRLFRLMAKLNFIHERPEYEHDPHWSENGDRFSLTLFRDYVFHQVDAQNNPVVDLGHVLTCLNKLDAGTDEKVTLISRDDQTCFVVSYRELKKRVESSFQELTKGGRRLH